MHEQERVQPLGLGPPDLLPVECLAAERFALVVEAAVLVVPAPVERMIDQQAGDLPCLGIVGQIECFRGLDQQVGRFDVVAERVVRRGSPASRASGRD